MLSREFFKFIGLVFKSPKGVTNVDGQKFPTGENSKILSSDRGSLPLKLILYLLCAALMIFYFAVLFSPRNTCIEYELYYVSDELSDWPGYGGLDYTFGDTVELGSEKITPSSLRRGKGWAARETEFCQTSGERSELLFRFENNGNLTASVNVGEVMCDSYDILVNEVTAVKEANVSNGTLNFDIPNVAPTDNGLFYITFVINSSQKTENSPIGIQIKSVTITNSTVTESIFR